MLRHLSSLLRRAAATLLMASGALCWSPATAPAEAEEDGRIHLFGRDYSVIAGASMFVPRSAPTRSIYGERSFAPVVDLWDFNRPRGIGVSWDLGAQRVQDGDRRADFVHTSIGPRILFAGNHADVAPYLTVRGGACLIRLDHTGWRTKPGANVELGASVLRHLVLSGRYDLVPKVGGVDLSGFGARVAVKLF